METDLRETNRVRGLMKPLTLYADMANWIDLAEERVDSGPLENAIAGGRVVPVLSLVHLLELAANANTAGRDRVADYMESLRAVGPFKWIQHYREVIRREATACFKAFGDRWESPVVFFDSFHETLPDAGPQIIMTVGEGMPRRISEMVDVLPRSEAFRKYLDDCRDYPQFRRRIVSIRRARKAEKRFTDTEKRSWLAELVPGHVNMTFGLVPVGDDLRKKFAESVDLSRCPAFRASWAFHEGANLDPKGARKGDIPDLWHLTGVAYSDVAFADKRTVEVLRKGAYDKLPQRNSEFSGWVRSLA